MKILIIILNEINQMLKQYFKGFKEGMHIFGQNISIIINSSLLFIVYLVGVGITSIFAKIVGKKFMDIKISKKTKTYWNDLNLNKKSIENYYRQF
jgi:hypothetical protein